jgi:hypothetical protein
MKNKKYEIKVISDKRLVTLDPIMQIVFSFKEMSAFSNKLEIIIGIAQNINEEDIIAINNPIKLESEGNFNLVPCSSMRRFLKAFLLQGEDILSDGSKKVIEEIIKVLKVKKKEEFFG